jgi:hypothetical protein
VRETWSPPEPSERKESVEGTGVYIEEVKNSRGKVVAIFIGYVDASAKLPPKRLDPYGLWLRMTERMSRTGWSMMLSIDTGVTTFVNTRHGATREIRVPRGGSYVEALKDVLGREFWQEMCV